MPTPPAHAQIRTEQQLAALCAALGAANVGGPLAAPEQQLIGQTPDLNDHHTELLDDLRETIAAGEDPLGEAFTRLRPGEDRRELGQFFTPPHIVDAQVTWTLDRNPARVVDAGCGSGRYAIAVARTGFDGHIIATDIDPLATLMVRANAAVLDADLEVRCGDFLTLELDDIDGHTAFIGNPPYVRHHSLPEDAKVWAKAAGSKLGINVSGLAGLHALFFLAVAIKSDTGDTCSFITSSEWTDANYGSCVRELLTGQLGLVRLDAVDPSATTFDDALTTAIITSSEVGHTGTAEIRVVADPDDLATLEGGDTTDLATLAAAGKWAPILNGTTQAAGRVPLGRYVQVKRGYATGANKFFLRTPEEAMRLGLAEYALPCITRANELQNADDRNATAEDAKKVILQLPADRDANDAVRGIIQQGEDAGVHEGYICSHRTPWWHFTLPDPPEALVTYMARQPPLFVRNPEGLVHTNTVHALYRQDGTSKQDLELLVSWMNSHRDELVGGRTYHGGLQKFEPKEMEALRVPPLDELREAAGLPRTTLPV